jgi:hypothetical protein
VCRTAGRHAKRTIPKSDWFEDIRHPPKEGDFYHYGNWGGNGWANGGWNPESGPLPNPGDPGYKPPIDARDACYETHDRNIHACPPLTPDGRVTPERSKCLVRADKRLHDCLRRLPADTIPFNVLIWGERKLFKYWIPYVHHGPTTDCTDLTEYSGYGAARPPRY